MMRKKHLSNQKFLTTSGLYATIFKRQIERLAIFVCAGVVQW